MYKHSNEFDEKLFGEENSIHSKLIEPRFAVKDFDVQPQYINHWRKHDLFFTYEEKRGRKSFSFIDYVWIRMIEKMKDIGLRFEIIQKVRDELQAESIWLERTDQVYDEIIEKAKVAGTKKEQLKELEEKKRSLFYLGKLQTYFSKHLTVSIALKSQLSFLINPKGEVLHSHAKYFNELIKSKKFVSSFQSFYISISVTDIIQEFIDGEKRQMATEKLQIISEEEQAVLDQVEEGIIVKLIVEIGGVLSDLFEGKPNEDKRSETIKSEFLDIITTQSYKQITFQNKRGTETKFLNPNQKELLNEELKELIR